MDLLALKKIQHECDLAIRRIGRALFQIKMRITGDRRPDGCPYITGDSFRALADHIYDEQIQLDPLRVKIGDIVFVSQELLLQYFEKIHPAIEEKYILICHNGDSPADSVVLEKIDDKVGHFFAQDLIVDDLADACIHLMKSYDGSEIVNIGTGVDVSIKELAEIIKEVVGYGGEIAWDTSRPDGTPKKLLDVSRLHGLGWKHRVSLEEGIKKTYKWYQGNFSSNSK